MSRIFLSLLVVIAIAALGLFLLLENPDEFKAQITDAIKTNSGYDIEIEGELTWRYWPPVAIRVEQITLAKDGDAPIASFDNIEIDLDLIPLLTQQQILDINLISIGGGTINVVVDETGATNWDKIDNTDPQNEPNVDATGPLESSIRELVLENLIVNYDDRQAGSEYRVEIESFHTNALTFDEPFAIELSAKLIDLGDEIVASTELTALLQYHSMGERVSFDELNATIDARTPNANFDDIQIRTSGELRTQTETLIFNDTEITLSGLKVALSGIVNLAGDEPRLDGLIKIVSNDLSELEATLKSDLPFESLSFETNIIASPSILQLSNLTGQFDDTTFKGRSTWDLLLPMRGQLDIRLSAIDLDRYSTGSESATSTTNINRSDVIVDSEIIPLDTLAEVHLDAIVRIDELTMSGYKFSNSKIETHNDANKLSVIMNGQVVGGRLVASLDTVLNQSPPQSDVRLSMDNLDIQQLTSVQGLTGKLTGHSDISFEGHQMSDLNDTAGGKTVFTVKDGSLDVRPIKSIAGTIDNLRGKQSSISQWPDVMPFNNMSGDHIFGGGFETGQVFAADIENLKITALGGFNMQAETLHYDITAMFRRVAEGQFKVSKQLSGIRWPITCKGAFTETPTDLCFGEQGSITKLVGDIVKQDLERRGKDKLNDLIEDKVPEEYKDLFKNLFK